MTVPTSVMVPRCMFPSEGSSAQSVAKELCSQHDVQYEWYPQGVILTGYWEQVATVKAHLEKVQCQCQLQALVLRYSVSASPRL